ncbi:MAG: tRNA (adenosine(37)-N6)-threonylcarbamoyltransferase complex dimerization subunit type 1 TsaB [Lachnospiraceae bacterium]|nr:tRNA (adenosine(37)-N6)-threonylcarbamoyltransferase complex dimerization subunit type 1 TsaB [Lachnospiraceae bacterium]
MKLLAIESAALTASAALLSDGVLSAEYTVTFKKTHSETLLPMVDEILKMTDTSPAELSAVAVSAGPGSFTGLRIGAAMAKGIAFAVDKPVVPVPTLDAMAYAAYSSACVIAPIMDARRSQVYTGLYSFEDGCFTVHEGAAAKSIEDAMRDAYALAEKLGKKIFYLGDGVPVFRTAIENTLGTRALFAAPHMLYQRAGAVAALGEKLFLEGKTVSADAFVPVYLRKSQAEREREESLKRGEA